MERDLNPFIARCLGWLQANLSSFGLPSLEDDAKAEEIVIELRRKAFGELVLACMLMSRYPKMVDTPQFKQALAHIEAHVSKPEYSFNMVRRSNLFPFYLTVLLGLEACGKTFPQHRSAIRRVLDFGHMDSIERTPWNQIDMLYYLELGEFEHGIADYQTLYRLSSIYNLARIPYLRGIDVYALTHILFYMADFGRRDIRPILAERFDTTREEVALLLGAFVYEKDWDLVAELLICCLCLDHRPYPLFGLAWRGLIEAQTEEGAIPLRTFDPESKELANPETADAYRFKHMYHTTLVGLFAAVLESRGGEVQ